eukprot:1797217-Rhodomonas_salina.1
MLLPGPGRSSDALQDAVLPAYMLLRPPYAMSGTDLAYGARRSLMLQKGQRARGDRGQETERKGRGGGCRCRVRKTLYRGY